MSKDERLKRAHNVAAILANEALKPVVRSKENVGKIERTLRRIANHRMALMRLDKDLHVSGSMLLQAEELRGLHTVTTAELARACLDLELSKKKAAVALGRQNALSKILRRTKGSLYRS